MSNKCILPFSPKRCEKHLKCKEMCAQLYHCDDHGAFYVISILAIVAALLSIICLILYWLYKKERNLRLTMWNVKTEDLRLDKMQWNSLETKAIHLEVIDEKAPLETKKTKNYYTATGHYKGRLVAVQKYRTRRMSLEKRNLMCDLDQIFMINHEHICKFYGANQAGGYVNVLTEYCTRGSLEDLLNDQSDWDDVFRNSLIFDIVKGMKFLHQTPIGFHGNLKPSNCLIDSRFMVKITDFGIIGQRFKVKENRDVERNKGTARKKLWTAPELLRSESSPQEGTKEGDVYSFAVIAQEILYQRGPFYRSDRYYTPEEIQHRVMYTNQQEVFRPTLEDFDDVIIHDQWRKTLRRCWAEKPKDRYNFQEIFQVSMDLQTENTLIDSLLQRLQKHSDRLEEKVAEKTEQYKAEKEKSDSLLYQMLPQTVANHLKVNANVMPESYNEVTVYFSDIVGFSSICHKSQPLQVVKMLNDLYTMFDRIIDEFDVYKVETIGDAYMVVSGLPIRNGNNHAREIARMAIRLRDSVCNDFKIRHMQDATLKLRVGIHTGPVVAGVVGLKMPRYCLFGDTVNTAARMEQSGKALKIHISPRTKEVLDGFGIFDLKKRKHTVTLKGLGDWDTWWLTGEKESFSNSRVNSNEMLSICNTPRISVPRSPSFTDSGSSSLSESSTGYNSDLFEIENESTKLLDDCNDSQSDDLDGNEENFITKTHFQVSLPSIRMSNKDITSSCNSLFYSRLDSKTTNTKSRTNNCTTLGAIF